MSQSNSQGDTAGPGEAVSTAEQHQLPQDNVTSRAQVPVYNYHADKFHLSIQDAKVAQAVRRQRSKEAAQKAKARKEDELRALQAQVSQLRREKRTLQATLEDQHTQSKDMMAKAALLVGRHKALAAANKVLHAQLAKAQEIHPDLRHHLQPLPPTLFHDDPAAHGVFDVHALAAAAAEGLPHSSGGADSGDGARMSMSMSVDTEMADSDGTCTPSVRMGPGAQAMRLRTAPAVPFPPVLGRPTGGALDPSPRLLPFPTPGQDPLLSSSDSIDASRSSSHPSFATAATWSHPSAPRAPSRPHPFLAQSHSHPVSPSTSHPVLSDPTHQPISRLPTPPIHPALTHCGSRNLDTPPLIDGTLDHLPSPLPSDALPPPPYPPEPLNAQYSTSSVSASVPCAPFAHGSSSRPLTHPRSPPNPSPHPLRLPALHHLTTLPPRATHSHPESTSPDTLDDDNQTTLQTTPSINLSTLLTINSTRHPPNPSATTPNPNSDSNRSTPGPYLSEPAPYPTDLWPEPQPTAPPSAPNPRNLPFYDLQSLPSLSTLRELPSMDGSYPFLPSLPSLQHIQNLHANIPPSHPYPSCPPHRFPPSSHIPPELSHPGSAPASSSSSSQLEPSWMNVHNNRYPPMQAPQDYPLHADGQLPPSFHRHKNPRTSTS